MKWLQEMKHKLGGQKDEDNSGKTDGSVLSKNSRHVDGDNMEESIPGTNTSASNYHNNGSNNRVHDNMRPTDNPDDNVLTLNDFNNLMQDIQKIIRDGRKIKDSKPLAQLGPLIAKLNKKTITYQSVVLPPLLEHILNPVIQPLVERSTELGDKYVPMLVEDIKNGRIDRMQKLMWMAFLNQSRLKVMNQEIFKPVRDYIQQKYHDDICSPDGHTAILPNRGEEGVSDVLWEQVDFLKQQGLVLERETITFMVGKDAHKLVVLTMSEEVE